MDLKKYHKKRDFTKSPEPKGKITKKKGLPIFVIQKHEARRLHYDFRLEHNGVLISWAIPNGPSLNPKDKRLAVKVEDHPYDYKDFEGIIPKGNYGAGAVIIWDKGYYYITSDEDTKDKIEKSITENLKKGKLNFILEGEKLKGEFVLIKTSYQENSWLLIKKKDEYASSEDILKKDKSVVSRKSINELESNNDFSLNLDLEKIKGAKKKKIPPLMKPMLATLIKEPFDDKDWLYEIKWDGYRALTYIKNENIKLYSRNKKLFNEKYSSIIKALQIYKKYNLIFDGELVVLDESGLPQFEWLQNYLKHPQGILVYYIFDLLYFDQYDLREVPLLKRKKLLKQILQEDALIRYCDHILENGIEFLKLANKNHLEGIIAKNIHSTYTENYRSHQWLKIKTQYRQEAIITGFTEPKGSRKFFGALILGAYEKGKLIYIGHSGGGFTEEDQEKLFQKLKKMKIDACPFETIPETNMPATWVKPILVCEISFTGWTKNGVMRTPIYLGLREDKKPEAVTKEIASNTHFEVKNQNNLKLTHLNKIYFPKSGYSKGDIIEYYRNIASFLLPHLIYRPQSLHRAPDGIEAEMFYQKDVDFAVPKFVETQQIYSNSTEKLINYILCNNEETLLYMVNLGCIEINPWLSRFEHIEYPDFAVIDLDPNGGEFAHIIEIALAINDLFSLTKAECYCKTSGAGGLHIYVPIKARYQYKIARKFVYLIAKIMQRKFPKYISLERIPEKRKNKIYIDYLQNRKGQTMAAPYSVRPLPGAPVSTPLEWSEVNESLNPKQFHIKNTLSRLEKKGDIFKDTLTNAVDIEKCIAVWEKELSS